MAQLRAFAEREDPVGILLAAGASTRTSVPKATLTINGRSFAEALIQTLLTGGCRRVVTVVSPTHARQTRRAAPSSDSFVTNPKPEWGMSGSLQIALTHRSLTDAPAVVVSPIDHPGVSDQTVAGLIQRWRRGDVALVRPRFGYRHGHPCLIGRELFAEIMRAKPGTDLKPLFSSCLSSASVDVDDPAILTDIDTPQELEDIRQAWRRVNRRNGPSR